MADESGVDLVELNELESDTSLAPSDENKDDPKSDPLADIGESDLGLNRNDLSSLEGDVETVNDRIIISYIQSGSMEEISAWLRTIPSDDKTTVINRTIEYDTSTALHLAIEHNQLSIAKLLMEEGADPNVKKEEDGFSVLHIACDNFDDSGNTEIVELILAKDVDIDAKDDSDKTPLHIAAQHGHLPLVKLLLDKNADMELKDSDNNQPIHLATEYDHHEVVEILVEKNPECVHWIGYNDQTPLLKVCDNEHNVKTAKLLIEKGANVNVIDSYGDTPLMLAAESQTSTELVKVLLDAGAETNPTDEQINGTPLQQACYWGCSDTVSLLLKSGAKVDSTALEKALSEGYEEIVKQLISVPEWPVLMRHTFLESGEKTTPFREMIRKMPDVAEVILNKCTVNDPQYENLDDLAYSVIFNYEFVEDTREDKSDDETDDDEADSPKKKAKDIDQKDKYECNYTKISERRDKCYSTSWGPKEFKKANHPLAIMVESKSLNLLTHPLVGSLLHHKWQKFGQYGYFINLLSYCVFLVFLTTFALIIENPRSQSCLIVAGGLNSTMGSVDCGISTVRLSFIYISSVVVLLLAFSRLVLEGIQLVSTFPRYLLDWINWMEVILFVCSIIFVWVFHVECRCPFKWQWQIGVVAVFLGWIDLIVFISKFPLTGIYVLMFVKIFYTFLRMLILSILLVVAFGLTFYLSFTQPEILRSPFSTPSRSLLKTMTMTTGEFDFDSIFRQDPTGESDSAEEIPFPPISYILWIVFVIIMPILLTNMLVGLAVGDIQAVQDEATLQKLALQVEQVLTVEELLPKRIRRRFICGYKEVFPNHDLSWRKKFKFTVWGGDRYDTRSSIGKVLQPHVEENEKIRRKTDKIIQEVEDLKTSVDEIKQLLSRIESKFESPKAE